MRDCQYPFLLQSRPGVLFWGTFEGTVLAGVCWENSSGEVDCDGVDFCVEMNLNTGSKSGPCPLVPIQCSKVGKFSTQNRM